MALKASVLLVALALSRNVLAFPLDVDSVTTITATATTTATATVTATTEVANTNPASSSTVPTSSESSSVSFQEASLESSSRLAGPTTPWTSDSPSSDTLQSTSAPTAGITSGSPTASKTSTPFTSTTTIIATVYQAAPTVTVTASPQTVTDTITIVPPPAPSSTLPPPFTETTWSAPPEMTDLSAFHVKKIASGKNNMRLITSDHSTEGDSSSGSSGSDSLLGILFSAILHGIIPSPPKPTSSPFLQLFYPANSINPGQKPQGGADFYAVPLDLSQATNVTLEYSVFFPSDFEWVQGGKLPGIYGGHDGCSGGDDAEECFSTRLMWRGGGQGELYLYAPKDEQTEELCKTPPQSVCDSDYGLSIGRGAFKFARGNWTHVRQTVTLNTPGEQDGAFTLDVNGKRVLDLPDVYYRGAPSSGGISDLQLNAFASGVLDIDTRWNRTAPTLVLMQDSVVPREVWGFSPGDGVSFLAPPGDASAIDEVVVTLTSTMTILLPTSTVTVAPTNTATTYVLAMETAAPFSPIAVVAKEPVGFTGIFFSTFFGGHEQKYATPKDQYTWFKDFAMTINA